jgi:cyclase
MLQKRIIPCLLLKDGLLVKTIQFQNPRHIGEPIYAIKIFNDYEVDELIIVDIMASRTVSKENPARKPQLPLELISRISDESCMPITYGGGISSLEDCAQLFRAGIEKVCINTNAIRNPQLIQDAAEEFGRQSIVVSIDTQQQMNGSYRIMSNCGHTREDKWNPVAFALHVEEQGAGEILLNSIDRDGMMTGYNIPLIQSITSEVHVPVIALGGAGKMEDFSQAIHEGGASAVAAGSMFVYFGRKKAILINYPSREEIEVIINFHN